VSLGQERTKLWNRSVAGTPCPTKGRHGLEGAATGRALTSVCHTPNWFG
jgi:hypothetical protein